MTPFALIMAFTLAGDPPPGPRLDQYGDPIPDGAIARLGTERFRRVGRGALVILPDGHTYREAHPGAGVTIRDCDLADGRLFRQRLLATESVNIVGLSRDGRVLATHRAPVSLDLWDAATGKHLRAMPLDRSVSEQQIALSPDGRFVAGVSRRRTSNEILLWNGSTGEKRLMGKLSPQSSFVFTRDSSRLIAFDGSALGAWDVATGKESWAFKRPYHPMFDCPPDGQTLLVSSSNGSFRPVRIDVQSGKPIGTDRFPPEFAFRLFPFTRSDRAYVIWSRRGDGIVWDLGTGKEAVRLSEFGHPVAILPDGKSVLGMYPHRLSWYGGVLQQWDLATGRALLPDTRDLGHGEAIYSLAFSPDGRRLASSSSDKSVRIWDLASHKTVVTLRDLCEGGPMIAFTSSGRGLVTAQPGRISVWDSASGKKQREFDPPGEPGKASPHVNWFSIRVIGGRLGAAGTQADGAAPSNPDLIAEWDLATGRLLFHRSCDFGHNRDMLAPNAAWYFDRDGKMIDAVTARVWAKLQVPPDQAIGSRGQAGFRLTADGCLVAAQLYDQAGWGKPNPSPFPALRVWETATGRVLAHFDLRDVGTYALSPDGRSLATSDAAGVTVWDVATGRTILHRSAHRPMRDEMSQSYASVMAFSPDGRTLATGHPDSTILMWDLPRRPVAAPATSWERIWADLAATDPTTGYAAVWRLVDEPASAVAMLKQKLKPVANPSAERLAAMVADLDSDSFAKRKAASKELSALGESIEWFLRDALKAGRSPESARRIEALLRTRFSPPSADALRQGRAVHALAVIGTREARALLAELANGSPGARLTRDAQETLDRRPKS